MKFTRLILILLCLPLVGTLGFILVEGLRPLDALYMAFITLSTVGYEVVQPLSDSGKIFVILYLAAGLALFLYSIAQLGEMAVSGELREILGANIMDRSLSKLEEHFIICGGGKMGMTVAQKLADAGKDFIVIDSQDSKGEQIRRKGWYFIEGDATDDDVLLKAGIQRATCLATVISNDADNLFVVMSAKLLNKDLTIITRAKDEAAIKKLRRAGADRVVSPYVTGANKVSQLMVNPKLEEFYELLGENDLGIDLTMIHVDEDSPYLNRRIDDLKMDQKGVVIVGVLRGNGDLLMPPSKDHALSKDDSLIAIGKEKALEEIFSLGSSS